MPERFSVSPGRPSPLGVTVEDDGINLAVVSRSAERIFICVFDQSGGRELARLALPGRTDDEVHHGFVAGIKPGTRYGLRAEGPFDPKRGHRFDPAKLLVDPYAVQIDRPFVQHPDLAAPRSLEIDTARLVPKAIVNRPLPTATSLPPRTPGFIYEIAVRAFTKRHPELPAPLRGTVAALVHPRILDHLLKLGVDTVELMPIAAWIDERHLPALKLANAWGYNPVTFMAPDPRIAPGGLAEIRHAVGVLHDAGIRVLLDVVMNHTGESDADGATLSLRGLDNALYYRHAERDPGLINDTGCGNTLAVDRAPVQRLVLDALRHWASHTGVDGFRFDLATVLGRSSQGFSADAPLFSAIDRDPLLAGLTFIAEPWDVGPGGYRLGQFPARWHEWNDRYRDDVRRFWRGSDGSVGALATRLAGSSDIFAGRSRPPSRSINYVAAHDGFTLQDLVSYRSKRNLPNGEDDRDGSSDEVSWNNGAEGPTADTDVEAHRRHDMRALLATLMVSRGTPMLTAGDEFGRSQDGNNNAYAQDNETTWLDWNNTGDGLIEFVSKLAALRRSHRALSDDRFLTGAAVDDSGIPDALWLTPDGREMSEHDWNQPSLPLLGLSLYAAPGGTLPADRICIWVNRGVMDMAASLPAPRPGLVWRIAVNSSKNTAGIAPDLSGNRMTVPARAIVVVAERADTRPRRSAKADDELIDRLATAAGIQPEWWQLDGTHHRVMPETKRALLKAMRLPAETASEATEMLIELQRERDSRSLPVSALLAAGSPGTVRLAMPEQHGDRAICLTVKLEDGGTRRLQFAQDELQEIGRVMIAGKTVRHLALPLPALPPGYHTAVLEEEAAQQCRLIVSPPTCFLNEAIANGAKLFGLTSHLYSLRHDQDAGIGDFETLSQFCEVTARLGGSVAGINPLHHLFPTDRERASPYQPSDRRFIDPIYIDLAGLDALVHSPRMRAVLADADNTLRRLRDLTYIDYSGVWTVKRAALAAAFADFEGSRGSYAGAQLWKEFADTKTTAGNRLRQHAVYEALADHVGTVDPSRWPAEWRSPADGAVGAFAAANPQAVEFRIWLQWIADGQLAAAATRARNAGLTLGIYRDLALGAAPDGGEIWANPEQFALDVSLGAPPDPFARDGQVWQLAPFEPHALRHGCYDPIIAMLAANMRHAGVLRIDHILGFSRQFWVPQGYPGKDGAYVNFPLSTLLAITAIESRRAHCTIVGEDLGTVPEGLRERLAGSDILSYRVLWFEKDGEAFRSPDRYPRLSVSCLSSHDLPTFVGWRCGRDIEIDRETGRLSPALVETRREARRREEQSLRDAMRLVDLPADESDGDLMAAAHELLAQTPSALVLVQTDDLCEETEPLNVPGTDRERPNWRRRQSGVIADLPRRDLAQRVLAAVKRGRRKIV